MDYQQIPGEAARFRRFEPDSDQDYQIVSSILRSSPVAQWMEGTEEMTMEEYRRWAFHEDKRAYLFAVTQERQIAGFVYYYFQEDEQERVARLLERKILPGGERRTGYLEISFAKNLNGVNQVSGAVSSGVRQTSLKLRNLYQTNFGQALEILALIHPDNQTAQRLVERCGFDAIGKMAYKPEAAVEDVVYRLEWPRLEARVEDQLRQFYQSHNSEPVDTRHSSRTLLNRFGELKSRYGWHQETIAYQGPYPIEAFISPKRDSRYLWVMGGVHGEEPASGEAFYQTVEAIGQMGQELPMVFLPLLSPLAREIDWRYENEPRDFQQGTSVTMCDHLLQPQETLTPREVPSDTGRGITNWVLAHNFSHPPLLVIDHHEDRVTQAYPEGDARNISSCYVYMSGEGGVTRRVAQRIVEIFRQCGLPVEAAGITRFGEPIEEGVVLNSSDNSVDDFLTKNYFIYPKTNSRRPKPAAETVLVAETTIPFGRPIGLEERVAVHKQIVLEYPVFWALAQEANRDLGV